jgi:hypothetical protein
MNKSPTTITPALAAALAASPTLRWMFDNGIPLTREDYIDVATAASPDDYEWDIEDELGMPELLRSAEGEG